MRTGYLPKEQRKKILLLSDDIRTLSGVGVMSREIVEETCHRYNWVQVGAGLVNPDAGKLLDMSEAVSQETGVDDASVFVYPYNGYGDPNLIRFLMEREKPDAILHFTDPRYWIWLYQMEHEIRQHIPLMYYNIWDDLPFPYYNRTFYQSCDALFSISKQTYAINKFVLGVDHIIDAHQMTEPTTKHILSYIPHGMSSKRYYPLPDTDPELQAYRTHLFGDAEVKFVVLYNSRNIRRKQTSDIILSFGQFLKTLPEERWSECRLILHTQRVDEHGTDLPAVINDVTPWAKPYIIFSENRVDSATLNRLYNIADVTISISSNEGFGISTCESLYAGTPIIVNVTGGLQDQCGFMDDQGEYLDATKHFVETWSSNHDGRFRRCGEWAFPVFPASRSLQGSPLTPYIFDDRVKIEDVVDVLGDVYRLDRTERKRRGELGRQFASGPARFDATLMGESFIQGIDATLAHWTPRKRFELVPA